MQLAQNIIARNYVSQDSIPNFFNSKSSFQYIVKSPHYKNYNVLTGKDYLLMKLNEAFTILVKGISCAYS